MLKQIMIRLRSIHLPLVLVILLIIVSQQLPNLYAWVKTPTDRLYTGQASWFDPWDVNVYLAAIKNGQMGHFLLANRYTTILSSPSLFYPLYALLGLVLPLPTSLVFHLTAIVTGAVLLVCLYSWLKQFVNSKSLSLLGLAICGLGGGLGWLASSNLAPADLYITSFTFQSALQRPHEALGILLYFSGLINLYWYLDVSRLPKHFWASLISWLGLVLFYPYYLLLLMVVFPLLAFLKHERPTGLTKPKVAQLTANLGLKNKPVLLKTFWVRWGSILITTSIATLIYYWHLRQTGFSSVATQVLSKPNLEQLLLGYGVFILFFAVWYCLPRKKITSRHLPFLITWVVSCLVLSLLPLGIARFFLRGLFFPLTVILLLALKSITDQVTQKLVVIFFVMLFLASRVLVFAMRIDVVTQNNPWVYLPADLQQVISTIDQDSGGGVLAPYEVANYLPSVTHQSVFYGHTLQTPRGQEAKTKQEGFFFHQLSQTEAGDFLHQNQIDWIVVAKNSYPQFQAYPSLEKTLQTNNFTLYRLISN
ncbi:MAG: hypothetical protein ABIJ03_02020 [Patescibacteria group bacterium]